MLIAYLDTYTTGKPHRMQCYKGMIGVRIEQNL